MCLTAVAPSGCHFHPRCPLFAGTEEPSCSPPAPPSIHTSLRRTTALGQMPCGAGEVWPMHERYGTRQTDASWVLCFLVVVAGPQGIIAMSDTARDHPEEKTMRCLRHSPRPEKAVAGSRSPLLCVSFLPAHAARYPSRETGWYHTPQRSRTAHPLTSNDAARRIS